MTRRGAITLIRRRSLGDVVLIGSITQALAELGPVTVLTDPPYVPLAARLRGVSLALPFGSSPEGEILDLQRDISTIRAHPLARKLRKRSLARLGLLWGLGARRPSVPELYAEAAGVAPSAPPFFALPERPRDTLALVPGAATDLKRWDPRGFIAVGRAWPGPVLVLGGPGEEELCTAVSDAIAGSTALCERGFQRTIDALASVRVALGADTGLLHLAAACGAAPVALFGPTHPNDGFFPYPHGRIVELALPCRPCTRHRATRCHAGHHGCMGQDTRTVIEAVLSCAG